MSLLLAQGSTPPVTQNLDTFPVDGIWSRRRLLTGLDTGGFFQATVPTSWLGGSYDQPALERRQLLVTPGAVPIAAPIAAPTVFALHDDVGNRSRSVGTVLEVVTAPVLAPVVFTLSNDVLAARRQRVAYEILTRFESPHVFGSTDGNTLAHRLAGSVDSFTFNTDASAILISSMNDVALPRRPFVSDPASVLQGTMALDWISPGDSSPVRRLPTTPLVDPGNTPVTPAPAPPAPPTGGSTGPAGPTDRRHQHRQRQYARPRWEGEPEPKKTTVRTPEETAQLLNQELVTAYAKLDQEVQLQEQLTIELAQALEQLSALQANYALGVQAAKEVNRLKQLFKKQLDASRLRVRVLQAKVRFLEQEVQQLRQQLGQVRAALAKSEEKNTLLTVAVVVLAGVVLWLLLSKN